jgi:hypothetical protein
VRLVDRAVGGGLPQARARIAARPWPRVYQLHDLLRAYAAEQRSANVRRISIGSRAPISLDFVAQKSHAVCTSTECGTHAGMVPAALMNAEVAG